MTRFALVLAIGSACALAACQTSTPGTPTPATDADNTALASTTPLPPLGIFRLVGDPATSEFSFTRVDRVPQALADSFAVDITDLSATTLRFTGVTLPDPFTLELGLEWEHPLPDTTNRRDLSVFDLRLHVMSSVAGLDFSGVSGLSAPTGANGATEPVLLADMDVINASGWSSWGDEVVEPAVGAMAPNLYPFILVHEDNGTGTIDPNNPVGWNVVPQATGVYPIAVQLAIQTGSSLDLLFALDASYGASAMKSIPNPTPGSRLNPRYFTPEFNLKEGWRASASLDGPVQSGNGFSSATLELTLFDHQGPLAASGAFDGATAPLNSIRYASGLDQATVSIPGALPTPIVYSSASFSGDGSPTTPYTYTTLLTGSQLTGPVGDYIGLVAFEDEMRGNGGAGPPLPTKGFDRDSVVQNRYDFATYATFPVTLVPAGPPTWTQIHSQIANGDPGTGATACIVCHVGGPNGLFMTSDKNQTYLNLVNVPSTCGDDYIEPNDPVNSFLYHKISTPTPDCGLRMPQDGPPYWSPEFIQNVADWINDGAQNN